MAKSVEEQVEDIFKEELKKLKVKYFTKTEPINPSIDNALKKGPSKANKDGGNFPDIKVFLETQNQRPIPVMIEVKGLKNKLIKLDKSKNIDQSTAAVTGYAVNGAVHYAKVVLQHSDYEEVIAVGLNGYKKPDGSLETEFQAFYLSRNNELYPKLLDDVTDFSLFKETNLEHLVDLLDKVNLSEEELEKLKKEAESSLEKSIQKIHQSLYDDVVLKPLLNTDQKLYLFCGLIMAALPIKDVANLTPADLKGNKSARNNDGLTLYTRIEEFLKDRGTPDEKRQIILNLLGNIFSNEKLYKPVNGESKFKTLFAQVLSDVIPYFNSRLHLDFTGKIFNKLSEWANISTDKLNDVVLTPRYVTNLMARLAQTNKDSFVLDSAMGSAGFLVSALEIMLQDAKDSISDQELLKEKIKKIKSEQICGIEILDTIFMLAVMNMVLVGDGSSNLQHSDSLTTTIDFPATVFLLNPPYSADGKGFNFVEKALSKMQKGFACVLIQENAGAGNGGIYPAKILEKSSLIASIKMPLDLFSGKASVQTAIYLFEAGKPHNADNLVTFIDFTEDGYTRMNRKKSGQDVNLRDTDDAKGRYVELVARVLNRKTSTDYYTEANGKLIKDTISLAGNDWTFSQHVKIDNKPSLEDFKQAVKDYLSWKVSEIIQRGDSSLGK
ncbi:HsdM family class I SAM-dependent methyltransferase [uncultured Turicimonas sp.]|uniref:HsdM family class I SAM-dependent methyltransferase n=1 Tax=uncultured Turicimonas sp. TaxID=1918607 RepID=UPI0028038E42|nr:N-6 DNA methylase [uncultured Turicimonas sp.]